MPSSLISLSLTSLMSLSVRKISDFHFKEGVQNVATPSMSLKLGHSLKKCVHILRGHALRRKDTELQTDADDFENSWNRSGVIVYLTILSTLSVQANSTKCSCCHSQMISINYEVCPCQDVLKCTTSGRAASVTSME